MASDGNRTFTARWRQKGFTLGSSRRFKAITAAVAIAAAFLPLAPFVKVWADSAVKDQAEDVFKQHEVTDTVSPRGVRLDLFDYWLVSETAKDDTDGGLSGYRGMGINAAQGTDRYLKFGKNVNGSHINGWTGSAKGPCAGIVQNTLGEDGYPHITAGRDYGVTGKKTEDQSLNYLFDGSSFDGKRAYQNTSGLLQLDEKGYYYYNSKQNYAAYNKEANSFVLYDAPAVHSPALGDKQLGQFFPFNGPGDVFTKGVTADGKLAFNKKVGSYSPVMHHYFGTQLTTNFMQPTDGKTSNGEDMKFQFTGDDDVWVFIDGVLVGDVGGIHDRVGLSIDFHTGRVYTYDGSSGANAASPTVYSDTTIKAMFQQALGDKFAEGDFSGDTFRDGTHHTLQFYYLERGNNNSNMALKFNLVSVPESTMTKVDQMGRPVEGAVFDLYATDANYSLTPDAAPLATGRTDAAGRFTFTLGDGSPLSFMKLYADKGYARYVLRERVAPAGHRPSPDGRLKYRVSATDKTLGFILSDNYWDSGVYARAEQTLGIEGDYVYGAATTSAGQGPQYKVDDGAVFAVIYRRSGADQGEVNSLWHSLSGDNYKGWKMSADPVTNVSQLRDAQIYTFEDDDKDGTYALTIDDMPGNPEYYYLMKGDASSAKYTVGFYYTTAVSGGKVDQSKISTSNTHRLPGAQFKRQTAANLYVTDIVNVFAVQKVDERERPVNGAEFSLYRAQDMQDEGSAVQPKPTARPVQRKTTETMGDDQPVQGKGLCYMGPLDPGIYYLVETKAPAGYVKNETATRVLVDAQGVHVDAGTKTDGVTAMVSTGSLVDSMSQFAAADDIDMTLYDVLASYDTAASSSVKVNSDGTFEIPWQPDTNSRDDLWLTYGATDKVLDYGADPNMPNSASQIAYIVPEGLAMCRVRQNGAYMAGVDPGFTRRYGNADWVDLGDKDLTSLYTGATCVMVQNKRQPSLTVEKHAQIAPGLVGPTATGSEGESCSTLPYKQFWMKLALTDAKGEPLDGAYEASVWENIDGVPNCVHTFENIQANDGKFYLHDGQTLEVYGLPQGASYTVEEIDFDPAGTNGQESEIALAEPLGFKQIASSNVKGTIGAVGVRASFTNEYRAAGSYQILVEKTFSEWGIAKDGFTFELYGWDNAPMPGDAIDGVSALAIKPSSSTAASNVAERLEGAFGSISFNLPGTYTYGVRELRPDSPLPGVTYSVAYYKVELTVTDSGNGQLAVTPAIQQLVDDAGSAPEQPQTVDKTRFVNTFDQQVVGYAPSARKDYIDHSGVNPLEDNMFSFTVEVPKGNPIPSEDGAPAVATEDMTFKIENKGTAIEARQALFSNAMVGKSFDYKFYENLPAEATRENNYTVDGMTYDPTCYIARATVGSETVDGEPRVKVDVAYYKMDGRDDASLTDDKKVSEAVFHNEFRANPVEVGLTGTKVLRGRDLLEGESYQFSLAAADEVTAKAIVRGAITLTSSNSSASVSGADWKLRAQVTGLDQEGDSPTYIGDFAFPNLAFSRAGEYLFAINEVIPSAGDAKPGMTYDAHTTYVKVSIEAESSDNQSAPTLKAMVVYDNGSSSTDAKRAVFTNVHQSFCTSDGLGLTVKKTLDGRDLHPGEFTFEIAGALGEGTQQDADAAQAKLLNESDKAFTNPRATDGVALMEGKLEDLIFTQDDAGRTFAYRIRERVPSPESDASALPGVVYDRTEYEYRLTPVDNGMGALALKAELYKVRESDGSACKTLLYSHDPANGEPEAGDDVRVAAFANSYSPVPVTLTDEWCTLTKHLKGRAWQEGDKFDFVMERVSYQGQDDRRPQTSGAAFDAMPLPQPTDVTDASPDYLDDDGTVVAGVKRFGFEPVTFYAPGTYIYRVREVKPVNALEDVTYSTREVAVKVEVKELGVGELIAYVEVDDIPQGNLAHFTNVYDTGEVPGPPVDPDPDKPVDPSPDPDPDPDPDKPVDPEPDPDPAPDPDNPDTPLDPDKPIDPETPVDPERPGEGDAEEGEGGCKPGLPGTGDIAMAVVLGVAALGVAGIAAGVWLTVRKRGQGRGGQ